MNVRLWFIVGTILSVSLSSWAAGVTLHEDCRDYLPRPIFDENPGYVAFYSNAWEIAHSRIDEIPGLPHPRYMDEAHRSDSIWI